MTDMRKLLYLLMAMLSLVSCDRKEQMARLAEMNIRQSVPDPGKVKILGVSEPDSAFGTSYLSQEEVQGMMMMMQKVSEHIMSRTDDMTRFNPDDREVISLAERQMRAMAEIRSMIHMSARKGEWTGWKIKVDYEAKDKDGLNYRAERWMFLDKEGRNIFRTFEIPIL